MKKALTQSESFVLATFMKFGSCPTMLVLARKAKMDKESVRSIMWRLVDKKYVKVNPKLKSKKFYVGAK